MHILSSLPGRRHFRRQISQITQTCKKQKNRIVLSSKIDTSEQKQNQSFNLHFFKNFAMGNVYNNSALLDFLNRGGSEISVLKSSIKNYFLLKDKSNTNSYNKR